MTRRSLLASLTALVAVPMAALRLKRTHRHVYEFGSGSAHYTRTVEDCPCPSPAFDRERAHDEEVPGHIHPDYQRAPETPQRMRSCVCGCVVCD